MRNRIAISIFLIGSVFIASGWAQDQKIEDLLDAISKGNFLRAKDLLEKIGAPAFPHLRKIVENGWKNSDRFMEDVNRWIKELGDNDWKIRETATEKLSEAKDLIIPELKKVYSETKDPEVMCRLKEILKEADNTFLNRIRFLSARLLIGSKDKLVIKVLIRLLEDKDKYVRLGAINYLRKITKDDLGYKYDGDHKERANAVARWIKWWEKNGKGFEMPKGIRFGRSNLLPGHTLIAAGSRVIELNPGKKIIWEFDECRQARRAVRLKNGNTLIADGFAHKVIEVNPEKEVVWEYEADGFVYNADVLENGNVLIAMGPKGVIYEIDRDGRKVREIRCGGNPEVVRALENGHILVAHYLSSSGVVEYDKKGKMVWQKVLDNAGFGIERLENGNTLIGLLDDGKIIEVDRSGKVLWGHELGDGAIWGLRRLLNGNTLVGLNGPRREDRVLEIDPTGKVVWSYKIDDVHDVDRGE
jgi:outer membrane protein assembly factor BamB